MENNTTTVAQTATEKAKSLVAEYERLKSLINAETGYAKGIIQGLDLALKTFSGNSFYAEELTTVGIGDLKESEPLPHVKHPMSSKTPVPPRPENLWANSYPGIKIAEGAYSFNESTAA